MVTMKDIENDYDEIFRKKDISKEQCVLLEEKCDIYLNKINKNIKKYLMLFNGVICDIAKVLVNEFPNDLMLKTYDGVIANLVMTNPIEPISSFILNIYSNDIYRRHIINKNDNFFLNNTYELKDNDKTQLMYHLKLQWGKLNIDVKDYIKNAMKTLVNISSEYIEDKADGNNILKILEKIQLVKSGKKVRR